MLRGLVVSFLLLAIACGPDAVVMPPSGVYQIAVEMAENSCSPKLVDRNDGTDAVRVEGDLLVLPSKDYLAHAACEDCASFATWAYWHYTLDEHGRYATEQNYGTLAGCDHEARMVADVLDERTIQARITDEWSDAGDCAWLTAQSCTTVREYTYTLVEACEGCTHDELQAELGY
jgi:hypothetical protein